MKTTVFLVSLLAIGIVFGDEKVCNNPADIVFVLDESGSIYGPHFTQQLEFVQKTIDSFDTRFNRTHVGVLTFATDERVIFLLAKYTNAVELKKAVKEINQSRGDTFTHLALKRLREEMFSPQYTRSWVPHIAIVITDGESNYPKETVKEAKLCHDANIQVFAIGVGPNVIKTELEAIASRPDMVHSVESYAALEKLRVILAAKACGTPTPAPTTTATPVNIEACPTGKVMDLILSISDQAGVVETDLSIEFIDSLTLEFNINPKHVQVGLSPKICDEGNGIRLKDYDTGNGFRQGLNIRRLTGIHTEKTIEYIRTQGHTTSYGGRSEAVKYGILIVDNRLENFEEALAEAKRAKDEGIRLLVIGVGNRVNEDQLRQLCWNAEDFVHVRSYSELADLKSQIIQTICKGITSPGKREYVEWFFY